MNPAAVAAASLISQPVPSPHASLQAVAYVSLGSGQQHHVNSMILMTVLKRQRLLDAPRQHPKVAYAAAGRRTNLRSAADQVVADA